MNKLLIYLVSVIVLFGCAHTHMPDNPPVIQGSNELFVRVYADLLSGGGIFVAQQDKVDIDAVSAEAERGCGKYGKTPKLKEHYCKTVEAFNQCQGVIYLFSCVGDGDE